MCGEGKGATIHSAPPSKSYPSCGMTRLNPSIQRLFIYLISKLRVVHRKDNVARQQYVNNLSGSEFFKQTFFVMSQWYIWTFLKIKIKLI